MLIKKLKEWANRYLPSEIFGTSAVLISTGLIYFFSGDRIVAAVIGTSVEIVVYYGIMIFREIHQSCRELNCEKYNIKILARDIGRLISEFGVAEYLDFILRPYLLYIIPLNTNNFVLGILFGKLATDFIFYPLTIIAREFQLKLKRH